MSRISKPSFLAAVVVLAGVVIGSLRMTNAGELSSSQTATNHNTTVESVKDRFFELRIYTAAPGKMVALNKRFRDHTLRLFEKHGIKSIGYWTTVDEKQQSRLYYIVAYPDEESREKMLVKGIARDPEFLRVVAESEKEGKLTSGMETVLMVPTDYSPIK